MLIHYWLSDYSESLKSKTLVIIYINKKIKNSFKQISGSFFYTNVYYNNINSIVNKKNSIK